MDYDDAYANGAYIPQAETYPPRWAKTAAEWRETALANGQAMLDQPYGTGARQQYDLFLPAGKPAGVVVFVHGGYWLAFDNKFWSHLAAGPTAHGWAVAMPSYTLAPAAHISDITRETKRAIETIAQSVSGPIILTGHSAGGHLVARMRCADVALAVAGRVRRIMPISPLSDLRPLLRTTMNQTLRLDLAEATAESPLLCRTLRDISTHVWVGAAERPAFLDQARWLAENWPDTQMTIAPNHHHFNVIDDLADADSALVSSLIGPA